MKFSSLAVLLSVSAAVNSQVVNDVNKRADGLSPDSGSGAGAGAGAGTGAAAPVPVPAAASVPLPPAAPAAPVGGATTGGVSAVTGAANTPAGAATTPTGAATTPTGAVTGAATGVSEPTRAANTQTPGTAPIGAAPAGLTPLSSSDPAGTVPGTSPISAVSPGEGSSTTVPSAKTSSGVFGEPAGAGFHSQSESSLSVLDIETSAAPSLITGAIGPNQATGSIEGSAKPGVAFGDSDSSGSSSSANAAQQGSRAGVGFIMAAVAMGSLLL